jgi:hypothetical protein
MGRTPRDLKHSNQPKHPSSANNRPNLSAKVAIDGRAKSGNRTYGAEQAIAPSSEQPPLGRSSQDDHRSATTDPAILIGLAIAFGKNGGVNAVPGLILEPLNAAAQHGCGASHIVLAWLERRAKPSGSAFKSPAALAVQNSTLPHDPSILGGHHGEA